MNGSPGSAVASCPQPQRGCGLGTSAVLRPTPQPRSGLRDFISSPPQGSRADAATLGWKMQPRCGCCCASRSEVMTVAVGFQPTDRGAPSVRVASARLEQRVWPAVQASLRDATLISPRFRGLKSTATVIRSLRDHRKGKQNTAFRGGKAVFWGENAVGRRIEGVGWRELSVGWRSFCIGRRVQAVGRRIEAVFWLAEVIGRRDEGLGGRPDAGGLGAGGRGSDANGRGVRPVGKGGCWRGGFEQNRTHGSVPDADGGDEDRLHAATGCLSR